MYSSSKNITEPEVAKGNFVLSLLAACSAAIPSAGKEGEATLSKQLSELLQDKSMPIGELTLLYTYKFGFNIVEALKFIGFDGKLEDFVVKQKCFSIHNSHIYLIQEELPAAHKPTALEDNAAGKDNENFIAIDVGSEVAMQGWLGVGNRLVAVLGSSKTDCCETASNAPTESTEEGQSDSDSDAAVTAWHGVGSRVIKALIEDGCFEDEEEDVVAKCVTESSDDGESDAESEVDATGWHRVGNRLITAMIEDGCFEYDDEDVDANSPTETTDDGESDAESEVDVAGWHGVGNRLITAMIEDGCFEHDDDVDANSPADEGESEAESDTGPTCRRSVRHCRIAALSSQDGVDAHAWKALGCHIAVAFNDDDDEEVVDADAWRDVSCRFATAFKASNDDECCEDEEDIVANCSTVGTDVGESGAASEVDVTGWHGVGNRLIKAMIEDGCFQDDVDAHAWKALGSRIAVAFHDDDDEEVVDADAWRDVSCRFATAFKASNDDQCCKDEEDIAANCSTESTDVGESGAESEVDVTGWHGVGNRLITAMIEDGCFQDDVDAHAWKAPGSRIAVAFHDDDDGEAVDADAWRDVSRRFAAAFQASNDDERSEDASRLHNLEDEDVDTDAWRDVSCRFAAACRRFSDDEESGEDSSPDVAEWRSVGANVLRCLEDSGDF
jgi:hypothetical protein